MGNAQAINQRQGWIRVVIGILALLSLGTVYSWSVFRKLLQAELSLSATQSLLPYTLALVFYAILMPLAGVWMERWGPRRVFLLGACLVFLGYLLASIATSAWVLAIGYGVFAGAGVGMAYGIPIAVSAQWMPTLRGLAIGCTVVGFGLSPLFTAPIAGWLVQTIGVRYAIASVGLGIFVTLLFCSFWMRYPRETSSLSELTIQGKAAHSAETHSFEKNQRPWFIELLTSRQFFSLWACFFLGTFLGLTAIGISASVGQELFGLSALQSAFWLSLFAVFNGAARPPLGALADRYSPALLATCLFVLAVSAGLLLFFAPKSSHLPYVVGFSTLWFTLGGWLALAPATTARLFGQVHFARNYGLLFTAYGAGALAGTLSAGNLRDLTGSYLCVFPLFVGVAVLGIFLATQIRSA